MDKDRRQNFLLPISFSSSRLPPIEIWLSILEDTCLRRLETAKRGRWATR